MNTAIRFIKTQAGAYLNVAYVTILGIKHNADGSSRVCADILPARGFVLGVYDSESDARAALDWIMRHLDDNQQRYVFAPSRDFRTQEVDE